MIALLFANGTEEIEALFPIDYFRRCQMDVKIIAVNDTGEKQVTGRSGITVVADYNINEVNLEEYDAIVFPGGIPGVDNIISDKSVKEAISSFLSREKLVAAICAAPAILAKEGLIKGRNVTCYPDLANEIDENGANYIDESVVIDGQLITSKGVGTTKLFAKAIAERFVDEKVAANVLKGMVF